MGRCTTNITTAKQSTIITLVVYFFDFFFFSSQTIEQEALLCVYKFVADFGGMLL
jgi:hypothetical protein